MHPSHYIKALSDSIINQIAAGEVVEGPISVVKELIENSLDADGTDISINLISGGLEEIEVVDDGFGILKNDLKAAVTRHHTSKLDQSSEALTISSLGFRGEALASIASVAEVELSSWHKTEPHAWLLSVKAGEATTVPVPSTGNLGTRICVKNLFDNVPARKAFLKQPRTEFFKIKVLVRQFSFAFPSVRFRLNQKGLRGLTFNPARSLDLSDSRWHTLFGAKLIKHLVPLNSEYYGGRVDGWVSSESFSSSRSDRQCLVINGRIVRDKIVQHAVRSAYGELLPPGKYSFYALSVVVPEANVDVNVHPAKLEVRIKKARELHDLVYVSVSEALSKNEPSTTNYRDSEDSAPDIANISYKSTGDDISSIPFACFPGRLLFVVSRKYLFFIMSSDLRVLDLRESWGTILDKRLIVNEADKLGGSTGLVIPERVRQEYSKIIEPYVHELSHMGFDIEDLGVVGALLRKIPKALPNIDIQLFLKSLCELLLEENELQHALKEAILTSIVYGRPDSPNRSMLDELARSAISVDIDILSHSTIVDSNFLKYGLNK